MPRRRNSHTDGSLSLLLEASFCREIAEAIAVINILFPALVPNPSAFTSLYRLFGHAQQKTVFVCGTCLKVERLPTIAETMLICSALM